MIVISACLTGENCKYNGGNNCTTWVSEIMKTHKYVLVCPECAGGLPTPRPPAEICDGRIVNSEGKDVTFEFMNGASRELKKIEETKAKSNEKIEIAILKAHSPSCGFAKIYDGSFTGKLKEGNGIFADLLLSKGIKIFTEDIENQEKLYEKL